MQETQGTRLPSLVGEIPWRRKWPLTPVFLRGTAHGQRNLVGYSPCGHRVRRNNASHVRLEFSHQTLPCPSLQTIFKSRIAVAASKGCMQLVKENEMTSPFPFPQWASGSRWFLMVDAMEFGGKRGEESGEVLNDMGKDILDWLDFLIP